MIGFLSIFVPFYSSCLILFYISPKKHIRYYEKYFLLHLKCCFPSSSIQIFEIFLLLVQSFMVSREHCKWNSYDVQKWFQTVTKYIETTTFCKSLPLPLPLPSINVDESENYTKAMLRTNYWPTTLVQGKRKGVEIELFLSFLRESPNKLCFLELSRNFCDWLLHKFSIVNFGKTPKPLRIKA